MVLNKFKNIYHFSFHLQSCDVTSRSMVSKKKLFLSTIRQKYQKRKTILGGGFNPFGNLSQIGNLPQIGVKIKKYLKPPPLKIGHPKTKLVFQPSIFRCMLASRMVSAFGGDLQSFLRQVAGCFSNTSASKASQLQVVRDSSVCRCIV